MYEFGRQLGLSGAPYLVRWLVEFKWFSVRIHHWVSSDDFRHFHDHPWWFLSFCLKGYYLDSSPKGIDVVYSGRLIFRRASHIHTVLVPKGCWTIMLTGPQVRSWGFYVKGKFKKANKYFFEQGHHQIDQAKPAVRTPTP